MQIQSGRTVPLTPTNSSVFLLLIELAGLEVGVLVEDDEKEDECRGNDERGDEHGVEDARLRPGPRLLLLLGLRDSLEQVYITLIITRKQ
jgi:hypothetical protein